MADATAICISTSPCIRTGCSARAATISTSTCRSRHGKPCSARTCRCPPSPGRCASRSRPERAPASSCGSPVAASPSRTREKETSSRSSRSPCRPRRASASGRSTRSSPRPRRSIRADISSRRLRNENRTGDVAAPALRILPRRTVRAVGPVRSRAARARGPRGARADRFGRTALDFQRGPTGRCAQRVPLAQGLRAGPARRGPGGRSARARPRSRRGAARSARETATQAAVILIAPVSNTEPRWPAIIALLAVGGIYAALPSFLTVGPRWLLLVAVVVLLIPTVISYRAGRHGLNRLLGYIVSTVITLALVLSLALLINALPTRVEPGPALLQSAGALWLANILVFALWYWRLDAGGPHRRDSRSAHTEGSFLFPQMTQYSKTTAEKHWSPRFIDYLFIAFNTSTAFSPSDTPVLSRWAKALTMLQSMISLIIVALLASRAIGIL